MKTQNQKINKRGVFGLDVVGDTMSQLLVLAILAVSVILALVTLQNSNLFTANSAPANQTTLIVNNVTAGLTGFFGNSGTFFNILAAVVILLFISLVIYAVARFSNTARNADSGGSPL